MITVGTTAINPSTTLPWVVGSGGTPLLSGQNGSVRVLDTFRYGGPNTISAIGAFGSNSIIAYSSTLFAGGAVALVQGGVGLATPFQNNTRFGGPNGYSSATIKVTPFWS